MFKKIKEKFKDLWMEADVKWIHGKFRKYGFEEAKNRNANEFLEFLREQYESYLDLKDDLIYDFKKRTTRNIDLFMSYNSFFHNLEMADMFPKSKFFNDCIKDWEEIVSIKNIVKV